MHGDDAALGELFRSLSMQIGRIKKQATVGFDNVKGHHHSLESGVSVPLSLSFPWRRRLLDCVAQAERIGSILDGQDD